jgi:hypothetical protein
MDGRLALDGLIPGADYDSRQPLYVYIIALVLKAFGVSYTVGRFIPVFGNLGIILFVFLIAKKMFDKKVALFASAIYAFLPFSILWSVIVHTQPVSVLLSCIGMYCVVFYIKNEKSVTPLILGGAFFSLAYYVRESALAMLLATFFYFLVTYRDNLKKFIKTYGAILAGFFIICVGAFAYYMQFVNLSWIWNSSVNPFYLVVRSLSKIFLSVKANLGEGDNFRLNDQPWSSTIGEVFATLHFNSFLYIGLLFSILVLGYLLFIKRSDEKHIKGILSFIYLLYLWVLSLAIFYFYWLLHRGFYMQYFEELLPPLVILLAFVVVYCLSELRLSDRLLNKTVTIGLLLAFVFIFHNKFLHGIRFNSTLMGLYVLSTVLVLASFWFFPKLTLKRRLYASMFYLGLFVLSLVVLKQTYGKSPHFIRMLLYLALLALTYFTVFTISQARLKRDLRESLGFILVSLVVSAFVLSFALSGSRMHLGFASTWSPSVVKEASDYIKLNSNGNADIMSGGVIWEFESGRRPFMNLSHPTAFRPGISAEMVHNIEQHMRETPPQFIVLDGYTEQTYLRHIKSLWTIIDDKYKNRKNLENGSRYPVKIYELTKDTKSER